uniref:hAT-like transposase RNase-H fold domain-containing protein n=1 Tax=Lactuca sativa TaxID=4236 RepID=A0A9R1XMS1_LACSA|nr:hypothetical protein LSAT_V11C200092110 [Lactuca sativa]
MFETNEYIEDETINLESPTNDPVSVVNETQPKNYKPRSKVWDEFERFTDKEGKGYGTKNSLTHLNKCVPYLAKVNVGQTQIAFGDENKLTSWKFDQKESRKALAHMLVVDELPFCFAEGACFKYYISVPQPMFKIPCRSTSTTDTYQLFQEEKENFRSFIKRNTSTPQSSYMCLTAHFVDNECKLRKKKVLSFCPQESHRRVDIGLVLMKKTFERYDLEEYEFHFDIEKAGLSIPSSSDWQHIRHLCHFLKPFCDVTERISGTLYVTSNTCIVDIYSIRTHLDDAIFEARLCDIALAMRVKFDKYFGNVEKMNLLLYFSLILDPRNKVRYLVILLEDRYGKEKMEEKKKYITDSMYVMITLEFILQVQLQVLPDLVIHRRFYGNAKMRTTPKPPLRNTLREKMKTNIVESIRELEKYLKKVLKKIRQCLRGGISHNIDFEQNWDWEKLVRLTRAQIGYGNEYGNVKMQDFFLLCLDFYALSWVMTYEFYSFVMFRLLLFSWVVFRLFLLCLEFNYLDFFC